MNVGDVLFYPGFHPVHSFRKTLLGRFDFFDDQIEFRIEIFQHDAGRTAPQDLCTLFRFHDSFLIGLPSFFVKTVKLVPVS